MFCVENYLIQVAAALQHLHVHGVRHGGVSVANIYVAAGDEAFVRHFARPVGARSASPPVATAAPPVDALPPYALLHNHWLSALSAPPFAKAAAAAAASDAIADDVWALAQCACAVLAGSHTAFARAKAGEPGLSAAAVRWRRC